MGTDASSDEDDPTRLEGGLAALGGRYLRPAYGLVALAAYLALALLGVYASWRFWSGFGLDYLSYAGSRDYLLAPAGLLRLVIDPGFVVVWLALAVMLALLAGCGGYLAKRLRSSLRRAWGRPRPAPRADILPFSERWQDHETLRSYLRALSERPLWAAPVLALAALPAINLDAAAEKRDLRSFARLVQHAYASDRYRRLGAAAARYELVSLPGPAGGREHLVRLRSTDGFVLYYDVLDDQPLVVAADAAARAVADARLADRAPPAGGAAPAAQLRGSQASLEGLKSSIAQLDDQIAEMRRFIEQLDGNLAKIDRGVGQLSELQAEVAQLAYADCPEMTPGRPLAFGADDASLSPEAVGRLLQARRQLTAERSPERGEWLVIEGHAAGSGQAGGAPPLAVRRAEAVRDFLHTEFGIAPEAVKLVGRRAQGPDADLVSLYDCLRRRAAEAPPTAASGLGLVPSAAAREVDQSGVAGPADWTAGDPGSGLAALLDDLDPQPRARGLLVTVPGDRLFDTGSAQIRTSAYGVLGRIGEALTRAPGHDALILGHSDAIGDAAHNLSLSERRARAVRDFLVERFRIEARRLAIEGRGEADPIATNETAAGRLANRRIEVLVLD